MGFFKNPRIFKFYNSLTLRTFSPSVRYLRTSLVFCSSNSNSDSPNNIPPADNSQPASSKDAQALSSPKPQQQKTAKLRIFPTMFPTPQPEVKPEPSPLTNVGSSLTKIIMKTVSESRRDSPTHQMSQPEKQLEPGPPQPSQLMPTRKDSLKEMLWRFSEHSMDYQQVIPRQTDILIVGGGLIGLCAAYFLKERSCEAIDVTLVERDPTYKQASSALAVGGIRQQFSSPENVLMSLYGAEFLRNVRDWLRVPEHPQPDVQYTPRGYLFLASERGAAQLEKNQEMQTRLGARVELLTPERIHERWPWMSTQGVALGAHGLENEGWFDPWLLVGALRAKCLELGVRFLYGNLEAFEIGDYPGDGTAFRPRQTLPTDIRYSLVRTGDGDLHPIMSGYVVNAAGAWGGELARMANIGVGDDLLAIPLPVQPRKRYVYSVHCPRGPTEPTPLVIDTSGVYFKREGVRAGGPTYIIAGRSPEVVLSLPHGPGLHMPVLHDPLGYSVFRSSLGGNFVVGFEPDSWTGARRRHPPPPSRPAASPRAANASAKLALQEAQEPDVSNLEVDYQFFEDNVWPELVNRAECFAEAKVKGAWAGYYDYNYLDQNLIIGKHPLVPRMLFVNGSSGHGAQHAPAIGRALVELIVYGRYTTINLERFSFDRFIKRELVHEKGVV